MSKPIVSLNSILDETGRFELDGKVYQVRSLRGRDYQSLRAMEVNKASDDVMELYRIAGACVPTLSQDQLLDLTMQQVQMVLAIASGGIVEVEETAPKATEGAEATPA